MKINQHRSLLFKGGILFILLISLSLPSIGQAKYNTTTAKKGEGIIALLRRAGLDPAKDMKAFVEINKTKLGKNNELIFGNTYYLPKFIDAKKHPIFGKKNEWVKQKDNALNGATYYLLSGHGGPDPGAISTIENRRVPEDEYCYDITLRLARKLLQHGAMVYLITRDINDGIRDGRFLPIDYDELCYPEKKIPRNHKKRLRQRTDAVNKLYLTNRDKFQRLIIVHMDSRSKKENLDVFFYYDKRSTNGKKLSNTLLNKLKKKYQLHQPNRGYKGTVTSRNLYVLKNTYPVATFLELGNMNHQQNQRRFMISENRQALANWLSEGLIQDYKEKKLN